MDTLSFHFQVAAWLLFPSIGSVAALALVGVILWLPFLSLLFLFGIHWPWVWFPCSGLGIFPVYSSLPFRLDLSGLGVGVPSQGPKLALA